MPMGILKSTMSWSLLLLLLTIPLLLSMNIMGNKQYNY